ncbi:uncharacterized protein (TIGR03086 family) [Actinocrispum wychmicini]|uniref:Uncharacterized protein (TIGR03086 family) n=1 Tax=Actinocrispum wychmicini TaxID=1213861 RepID=A0A4R2J7C8_9PSEU|nr:uncharacterized protein (TIGR03086 family) [Actinocrispum wychmicini]
MLERAIGYTLGSLRLVTPAAMARPTPCREWDLSALLRHMDDSLAALHEAVEGGFVSLEAAQPVDDPVLSLRNRACRLLGAWTNGSRRVVSVADRMLASVVVGQAGALEIAVHGWDVASACGADRPIPAALAEELLRLALAIVTEDDRPGRFGPPVAVRAPGGPAELLLAFLGR